MKKSLLPSPHLMLRVGTVYIYVYSVGAKQVTSRKTSCMKESYCTSHTAVQSCASCCGSLVMYHEHLWVPSFLLNHAMALLMVSLNVSLSPNTVS